MSDIVKDLAKNIDSLTIEQARELVKTLVEEYGYILPTATTTTVVQATEEPIVEEKKTFDAVLTSLNDKKIQLIKAYNTMISGSLMKTKAFLESPLPLVLQSNLSKEQAEAIKAELEAVGGSVSVQ